MVIIDNFTEEELREIVKESFTYKEVLQKLGYKTFGGRNNETLKRRLEKYNISISHFTISNIQPVNRNEENVFCKESTASQATLRRWFTKGNYIPYKCSICGIDKWQEKKLSLQLDHINGDNHDNRLENLRWLCPNCHSQTSTFCGKQTKKKHSTKNGVTKKTVKNHCIDCGKVISRNATRCAVCASKARRTIIRPSKEKLYSLLCNNKGNFTEIGRMFDVTDNTIRKWCKGYDLPTHSSDYKNKVY